MLVVQQSELLLEQLDILLLLLKLQLDLLDLLDRLQLESESEKVL